MKLHQIVAAALLGMMLNGASHAEWQRSTELYVSGGNTKSPVAVFVNSYTPAGFQAGTWYDVDLKPYGVSADAKGAFLSGLLIITHGQSSQTCDMTVVTRAPGNQLDAGNYQGQVVEAHLGGGQRSGFSSWVPLVNGVFQFRWDRNTYLQWPQECAYGINLSLQAWSR